MAITWREQPKKRKDGRSSPTLRPCPPEEQRYLVKFCKKDRIYNVMESEGAAPTESEILAYLSSESWFTTRIANGKKVVVSVLSTRPRPRHVKTYVFCDQFVRRRIRRERQQRTANHQR